MTPAFRSAQVLSGTPGTLIMCKKTVFSTPSLLPAPQLPAPSSLYGSEGSVKKSGQGCCPVPIKDLNSE
jgi:hypothetical protein